MAKRHLTKIQTDINKERTVETTRASACERECKIQHTHLSNQLEKLILKYNK